MTYADCGVVPDPDAEQPATFEQFVAKAYGALAWANQSRFQMPWRV